MDAKKEFKAVDVELPSVQASQLASFENEESKSASEAASELFTVITAGLGLISDGIQNNIFSLTNVVFGQLYGSATYTSRYSTQIANALTVGTIFGQLASGVICDRFGRKVGIMFAVTLIVLGIILATASHGANGSVVGFFWMLTVARGITGVGVGAEYSCSSSSAVEAANARNVKSRGTTFVLVTNLVLSLGGPVASILYLIVFQAAGGLDSNLSTVWRTVFGISIIPPLLVFAFRLRMKESTLYQKSAIQTRTPYMLAFKYYWRSLIGTCGAWFLYDVIVFPLGVFSGTILSAVITTEGHALVRQTAQYNLLLGAIGIPGIFVGLAILPYLGRRYTMMVGFAGFMVFGAAVGGAYDTVTKSTGAFIFLYGMLASFGNLGPGNMLGLTSSESYATPVRARFYGLSAAVGKTGAVVGNQTFAIIRTNLGPRYTFIISACLGFIGLLVTYFFIRSDLDGDLSLEDARFAAYLTANGFTGHMGVVAEPNEESAVNGDGSLIKSDSNDLKGSNESM